jgi:hypothetical protein
MKTLLLVAAAASITAIPGAFAQNNSRCIYSNQATPVVKYTNGVIDVNTAITVAPVSPC